MKSPELFARYPQDIGMSLTPDIWHERFQQQALWTEPVRRYLLSRLELKHGTRMLEVGCGTGVITTSLAAYTQSLVYGLDLNPTFLALARQHTPSNRFTCGNVLSLPYQKAAFNVVVCHYFLLWIAQPEIALAEMTRVIQPGGAILAFAEPDYGGRIDSPAPLGEIGQMQADALREQEADPEMGRRLSGLFHAAGLRDVETGVLGGQWKSPPSKAALDLEWKLLEADLNGRIPGSRLEALHQMEAHAWQSGERVLFVPTFYAIGWK